MLKVIRNILQKFIDDLFQYTEKVSVNGGERASHFMPIQDSYCFRIQEIILKMKDLQKYNLY